jgi:Domain of unknown function (DUF4062)
MAKPRIFISSTFYDLKQVRSSLEVFIRSLGFDPVLSEKGSIAYSPDVPLDESCYREAQGSDVFVLIVGGRYGSEVSGDAAPDEKGFFDRYESITRKEYESAIQRDIPTYVLIEKSVYSEYEIFKRNRDNETIKYASVNSINIFIFIEYVLGRPRNSPVFQFELSSEIETWLRDQWSGLFRELIRTRADRVQLQSLADQVTDLRNTSTTLKRYLEEVVSRVGKEQGQGIIDEEQARLAGARELNELEKLSAVRDLRGRIPLETVRSIFSMATSLDDLARRVQDAYSGFVADEIIAYWKDSKDAVDAMNEVRAALDLPSLAFEPESKSKKRRTSRR